VQPAAVRAGLGQDIGWHTFRHSFRTLLDSAGAPIKVQQELMLHAHIRTTMNVYGQAPSDGMRKAHGQVMKMVLRA
jgi:site-specific recombinase XerD